MKTVLIWLWFLLDIYQHCFSLSFQAQRSRVSIDYGPRTIGVAYSNYCGLVQPHGILKNNGDLKSIASKISALAKSWNAAEIIVGVPLDSNGKMHFGVNNFNGQLCINFSRVLSSVTQNEYSPNVLIKLFDERYTTKEAKLRLKASNVKGKLE